MICKLNNVSKKIGLHLNTSKTKVSTKSTQMARITNGTPMEYVDSYVYLGNKSHSKNRDMKMKLCVVST